MIELATLPQTLQQQIVLQQPIAITDKGKIIATVNPTKSYANGDFNFDLARMERAVESGLNNPIAIPKSALADIDAFDNWLDKISNTR